MKPEYLLAAGGMLLCAAGLLLAGVLLVLRRARGGSEAGPTAQAVRRSARQVRQLNRLARRIEARVQVRVERLRELVERAEQAAARLGETAPAPPGLRAAAGPPLVLEKQRDQIFRLSFQGLEPMDIARRLDLPVGEVELTLSLHRPPQAARTPLDEPG